MADHQKEMEEFGNNDDFWLFGYGYTTAVHIDYSLQLISTNKQKSDLETSAAFRYIQVSRSVVGNTQPFLQTNVYPATSKAMSAASGRYEDCPVDSQKSH